MFSFLKEEYQNEIQQFNEFYEANQQSLKQMVKIAESQVLFKFKTYISNCPQKVILYQDYLAAINQTKIFLLELQLSVTFQADLEAKIINLKTNSRTSCFQIKFIENKEFEVFYNQLKRFIFQTDFHYKYQLKEKIGEGKTSNVFNIINQKQNKLYAAKVYKNIPPFIKNQIKILRELEHPNLIYFHQVFIELSEIIIIMDHQDGGNLLDKIKSDKIFTLNQRIKFLIDMLNAFQFLRIMNIVHRDLKPQNILYSKKEGNYKIADFSLAVYENQPINKLCGTPGYIAPELFETEKSIQANQLSDIYSLGLIYFQIATKKPYFNGKNLQDLIKKNKQAKSLKKKKFQKEQISDVQYDILRMMIRKQPQDRHLSIQILQSSEIRKVVKDILIQTSSNTSSPSKTKNQDDIQDHFLFAMKKLLNIRNSH